MSSQPSNKKVLPCWRMSRFCTELTLYGITHANRLLLKSSNINLSFCDLVYLHLNLFFTNRFVIVLFFKTRVTSFAYYAAMPKSEDFVRESRTWLLLARGSGGRVMRSSTLYKYRNRLGFIIGPIIGRYLLLFDGKLNVMKTRKSKSLVFADLPLLWRLKRRTRK